jgi:hypothetical protein|tara:strand:- start:89 stop:367 length:279 start_codon:yes stop_codon:yes gene_type:complete
MDKNKIDFNELQRSVEELKFKTVQDSNSFDDKVIYLLDKLILLVLKSGSISNENVEIIKTLQSLLQDQISINKGFDEQIQKLELRVEKLEGK